MILGRRFKFIILFIFFISILFGSSFLCSLTLRVGVYQNAPKIFIDDSGRPSGIFIDVLEYIASREKWDLEYHFVTWDQGLQLLSSGEIDLMPDVACTPEREQLFSFHENPVLTSWSQVYASKGSGIRSIIDLENKRVAVLEGSVHQTAFLDIIEGFALDVELISFEDFGETFRAISQGEADATIANNFYGMLHVHEFGLESTAVIFNPSQLFFAINKEADQAILSAIDKHLTDLKSDHRSVYYQSLRHWTGEEIDFRLPSWLLLPFAAIMLFSIISLIFVFTLKHQVRLRTAELMNSNREMEQRIVERTAELAAAMDKAQEADRLKSAFLATMSHELRTPLNSIIGFTGILKQELAGPLNNEQKKQLTMVMNSSRHLLLLINDVLDISKIEAGQLDLLYTEFELKDLVANSVRSITPAAEKKGLEIKVFLSSQVDHVYGDRLRLEQVLLNLLSNAVKFTDRGYIEIDCRPEGKYCSISVRDTGIGIAEESLKSLFRPFSQLDTGLTRKYEGSGLGLSICKKLIEMMSGSISVDSEPGKGSTFKVLFPISKEELNA